MEFQYRIGGETCARMRAVPGTEDSFKTGAVPAVGDRTRSSSITSTSLAESLTIGILRSDPEGLVKSSNSVARRVFAVGEGKLEGTRITELFEAKDAESLAALVSDVLRAQKPREFEMTALSKRGPLDVRV